MACGPKLIFALFGEGLLRALLADHSEKSRKERRVILPSKACVRKVICYELGELVEQKICSWDDTKALIQGELGALNKLRVKLHEIRRLHEQRKKIELEREYFSKAIDYFGQAVSLLAASAYSRISYYDSPSLAYYRSRNIEKAEKKYKLIISHSTGRIDYGDIYAKSFYMLGKIFEKKGNKGKAIEHYEKFLNLWKDADPGLVEAEDARKRPAGLKSQRP